MKIFLSWSGHRSRATAELLCDWIKCVLQASRPWISSRGIDRGALWFSEINNELKDTSIGIICLTQENKNKPWILFEAGALAKGLETNRVCTFLIDLKTADLQDPLAQFNHTFPNKDSVWNMVLTLNSSLGTNSLDSRTLDDVFETYWPQFEEKFEKLIKDNPEVTVTPPRDDKDMLSEILDSIRGLNQRMRSIESNSNVQKMRDIEPTRKHSGITKLSDIFILRRLLDAGQSPADVLQFAIKEGIKAEVALDMINTHQSANENFGDSGSLSLP